MIPNNGTTISLVCVTGDPDYLATFVNTIGLTVYMLRCASFQRLQGSDAVLPSPHESVYDVAFNKRRVAGEPDHITSLVDCRRRIPPRSWRIWIYIRHGAIFPKHGMLGRMSSNGLVADAGDAHDLAIVIDRRRGS